MEKIVNDVDVETLKNYILEDSWIPLKYFENNNADENYENFFNNLHSDFITMNSGCRIRLKMLCGVFNNDKYCRVYKFIEKNKKKVKRYKYEI